MEGSTVMEALTTALGVVTTAMGDMVEFVVAQPITLIPIGIGLAGAAIGLCARLIGN